MTADKLQQEVSQQFFSLGGVLYNFPLLNDLGALILSAKQISLTRNQMKRILVCLTRPAKTKMTAIFQNGRLKIDISQ